MDYEILHLDTQINPAGTFYIDTSKLAFVYDEHFHPVLTVVDGGGVAGVSSFNGRTGAVMPKAGDYSADMITGAASSESLTEVEENVSQLETAVANKQDKLAGTTGELVGFDATGMATPVTIVDGGEIE